MKTRAHGAQLPPIEPDQSIKPQEPSIPGIEVKELFTMDKWNAYQASHNLYHGLTHYGKEPTP
jgi:hypothetical protein